MKSLKYFSSVVVALFVLCLVAACSGQKSYKPADSVFVHGQVDSALNNQMLYLVNPFTGAKEDSTRVTDLKFDFGELKAYQGGSVIRLLTGSYDFGFMSAEVTMPLALENGDITVLFGESQAATGSELNDRITDFEIKRSEFADNARSQEADVVRAAFSDFMALSVMQNQDNAFGAYLFDAYKDKFAPEKYAEIKATLGERLNGLMK